MTNNSAPSPPPSVDWAQVGPALLASLQELTGDYDGGADRAADDAYVIDRALAAIAKATGATNDQ